MGVLLVLFILILLFGGEDRRKKRRNISKKNWNNYVKRGYKSRYEKLCDEGSMFFE